MTRETLNTAYIDLTVSWSNISFQWIDKKKIDASVSKAKQQIVVDKKK